MGILKDSMSADADYRFDGYTDQRSDGDTESRCLCGSLKLLDLLHRPTIRWGY